MSSWTRRLLLELRLRAVEEEEDVEVEN